MMSDEPDNERIRLNTPPHTTTIQFGSAWNIVSPAVYRYENKEWIDQFFATGALRLSSFAQFSTYRDEFRGDTQEGHGICFGETKENNTVVIAQAQDVGAAVFCCSYRLDHKMREEFGRDSAFQISNTVGFALEISRQLAGFRHGLEGACLYRSDTSIKRAIDFDIEEYRLPDGNLDMRLISDSGRKLGGPELLLMKRKRYEAQQEYRLIWELDDLKENFIDVFAPLARQYCRQVVRADWDD